MVEWFFPFFRSTLPGNHFAVVKAAHGDIGKTICFEAGIDEIPLILSEVIFVRGASNMTSPSSKKLI